MQGEFRPEYITEPKRPVAWPWVLGFVVLGLGGWHIYCSKQLERAIYEYITTHLGKTPVSGQINIHVQPVTNLVSINLVVVDKDARHLKATDRLLLDAMLSVLRSEAEPYLERELGLAARKQVDPYAMALPYRIAFSLDIQSGT